jgi:hypothetical protein
MSRIKRPSPALVVAVLALVAAIVVPAFALTKKEKRVVRKVANAQITKRAPGLAVASANTANSADTAGAANTATTALSADDTAEVASPARLVFNDSAPGDPNGEFVDVISAGSFTIRGRCESFGGAAEDATLSVVGPDGSSFSAMSSNGANVNVGSGAGGDIASVGSSGNVVQSGHAIAAAPNGQVVSVTGSVEVGDPAGHCLFAATAIGP